MSDCDNCIHFEDCLKENICHKGHIIPIPPFKTKDMKCKNYEHWNSLSGDGV